MAAAEQLTAVLADEERILGSDHPSTLISRQELGKTFLYAGQVDNAIDQLSPAAYGSQTRARPLPPPCAHHEV